MQDKQAAQEYYERAGDLFQRGMLEQAITALQKSIALDPGNPKAYNDLGRMHQFQGETQKAESAFLESIRLDPSYHEPHNNLGILYYSQGKAVEAVREFEITRKLKPDYPDVYNNLGAIYFDLRRWDDAIGMFEKALELSPGYAMAYNNLHRAQRSKQLDQQERGGGSALKTKHLGKPKQASNPAAARWIFWIIATPILLFCAVVNPPLGTLACCCLCAGYLVFLRDFDPRSSSKEDAEFRRLHTGTAKIITWILETIKLFILVLIIGYLEILLSQWAAKQLGLARAAAVLKSENQDFFSPFSDGHSVVWAIATGIALLLTAVRARRISSKPVVPYDIFISYKSHNANIARQVAERLMGSGYKVWFAEYELLIKDQLFLQNLPEEERNELITNITAEGISHSRYGLAFTNNLYAGSPYCESELSGLIEKLGPEKVFEVMIPREDEPHRKFEGLAQCPSMVYSGSTQEVLDFLSKHIGWTIAADETEPGGAGPQTRTWEYLGKRYSIRIDGWTLDNEGERTPQPVTQDQKGPSFNRMVEGGVLTLGLILGGTFGIDTYRTELARLETDPEGKGTDDRKLYGNLIQLGNQLMKKLRARPRGLHLVHQGGHGQFALTYNLWGVWTRTYSIILEHPVTHELVEFVFTAGCLGLSFQVFCENARLFDNVVDSLRWD